MLGHLLLTVIALAIIYYLIITFIPLPAPFRVIVNVIFAIICILIVLQLFGGTGALGLGRF